MNRSQFQTRGSPKNSNVPCSTLRNEVKKPSATSEPLITVRVRVSPRPIAWTIHWAAIMRTISTSLHFPEFFSDSRRHCPNNRRYRVWTTRGAVPGRKDRKSYSKTFPKSSAAACDVNGKMKTQEKGIRLENSRDTSGRAPGWFRARLSQTVLTAKRLPPHLRTAGLLLPVHRNREKRCRDSQLSFV